MVYFGALGKTVLHFFESSKLPYKQFEKGDSEAEWIVDITTKASMEGEAHKYQEYYENSTLRIENERELAEKVAFEKGHDIDAACKSSLNVNSATEVNIFYALKTLFRYRTMRNYMNGEYIVRRDETNVRPPPPPRLVRACICKPFST